jgi:hypothetical protein
MNASNTNASKRTSHRYPRMVLKALGAFLVGALLLLPLAACERDKGPLEEIGEEIDEAVDEVKDEIEDKIEDKN